MLSIGSWGPSDIVFLISVVCPSVSASHRGSLSINSNVPSLKGLYSCNEACNNIPDILLSKMSASGSGGASGTARVGGRGVAQA